MIIKGNPFIHVRYRFEIKPSTFVFSEQCSNYIPSYRQHRVFRQVIRIFKVMKSYIENNQPEVIETLHDFLSATVVQVCHEINIQFTLHQNGRKAAF